MLISLVGTSAVAVSASALGSLLTRWRPGNMEGRCAAVRDGGVLGAFAGSAVTRSWPRMRSSDSTAS